ncbi:MAG: TolC family protein [Verrucomicrobiota bacterium]
MNSLSTSTAFPAFSGLGLLAILCSSGFGQDEPILPPSLTGEAKRSISITLEEAVRKALAENVNMALERLTPELTSTTIDEAKAAFDPTSTASVNYRETSTPRSSEQQAADGRASSETRRFDAEVGVNKRLATGTEVGLSANTRNTQSTFNSFSDEYNTFTGITFTHPLLRNSGTNSQLFRIRSARKQTDADWADFRHQVENTIQSVHNAYYNLLFAYEEYRSRAKAVATAERLMVDNQNRYELGTMTPLDVAQARSEVSQRMSDLLLAELTIQQNQTQLKRLIFLNFGDHVSDSLNLTDNFPEPEALPAAEYNIGNGLQFRNDYKALLVRAERSGLEIKFRRNQLYPQLDLTGRVGLQGRDSEFEESVQNILETRDEDWGVGLSINIPWGVRAEKARLQRSVLQQEQLLLQIKDKEHEIIQQITDAYHSAENARLRHLNNRQAREISDRTAIAEEEKLKEGISTSFTVLQLQRDATTARTRELRSLVTYYQALIELRRSQGLLLKDHGLVWDSTKS